MSFTLQRFALAPASVMDVSAAAPACPEPLPAEAWGAWLANAGLGAWWHSLFPKQNSLQGWDLTDIDALRNASRSAAASYLLQSEVLRKTGYALDNAGIDYVVFKGAHIREWLYDNPTVRTSVDVDILVAFEDRLRAISTLQQHGFTMNVIPQIASHEVQLIWHEVEVDLHWDVMRPGRTRSSLVSDLLSRRIHLKNIPVPCAEDAAVLMLVQPAFADHVCGPTMPLIRALDFYLLTQRVDLDWDRVTSVLAMQGVKTAAWTTLHWFLLLNRAAAHVPAEFVNALTPPRAKAGYLLYWLEHDLPTRTRGLPGASQVAFTLALHDTARDAARAAYMALRARLHPDRAVIALGKARQ